MLAKFVSGCLHKINREGVITIGAVEFCVYISMNKYIDTHIGVHMVFCLLYLLHCIRWKPIYLQNLSNMLELAFKTPFEEQL